MHDFDDIVVDVPLVADYVASIISALYLVSAIDDLSFSLHLPDENNFSLSPNQYSLIVKVVEFFAYLIFRRLHRSSIVQVMKLRQRNSLLQV